MNARMQELCGHEKEKAAIVAQYSPPVVQPAPERPAPVVQPAPPPKKDRN